MFNPLTSPEDRATGLGALAVFFWCWSGPCFRVGAERMGSMPYLALSCLVGVGVGIVVQRRLGYRLRDLFVLPWRVLLLGVPGLAGYTALLTYAVGMAPRADLGQIMLINYLWPILIVVFSLFLLPERVRLGPALGGAAMGLLGIAVARDPRGFLVAPESLLPHAMSLAGATLFACYSVMLRRWRVPDEKGGSTVQWITCAAICAAVATLEGPWPTPERIGWTGLFWIVFLGIGPIGLGYYCWEMAIKRGRPQVLSAMAYFTPVGSVLIIGLLFREALSWWLLPGTTLIVAGAVVAGRAARREPVV